MPEKKCEDIRCDVYNEEKNGETIKNQSDSEYI